MKRKTFLFSIVNSYPTKPTPIRSWINQYHIYKVWFCVPPRRRLGFGVGRQFLLSTSVWARSVNFWATIATKQSKSISLITRLDWRTLHGRASNCACGNRATANCYDEKSQKIAFMTYQWTEARFTCAQLMPFVLSLQQTFKRALSKCYFLWLYAALQFFWCKILINGF